MQTRTRTRETCPSLRRPLHVAPSRRQGQPIPGPVRTHATTVDPRPLCPRPRAAPLGTAWQGRRGGSPRPEPGTHTARGTPPAARARGVTDGLRPGRGKVAAGIAAPPGLLQGARFLCPEGTRLGRAARRPRSAAPNLTRVCTRTRAFPAVYTDCASAPRCEAPGPRGTPPSLRALRLCQGTAAPSSVLQSRSGETGSRTQAGLHVRTSGPPGGSGTSSRRALA